MNTELSEHKKDNARCRFCDKELTNVFADLGESPLANSFLSKEQLERSEEKFYPLKAFVCEICYLVQLQEFEKPENIFSEYAYFSSYSKSWLEHCKNYAGDAADRFHLGAKSQVIEIASNDGYLLQFFKEKKIPILGIEPAANVAKVAAEKGIETMVAFFDTKTAQELKDKGMQADLLVANNVLAHVPNLNEFVKAMKIALKPDGVISIEFPHVLQLIASNQFDTIYHEHFSYFSLIAIQKIFKAHGLVIFDVDEIPTHGGSLRIYGKHAENIGNDDKNSYKTTDNVENLIKKETEFGLQDISTYTAFNDKITSARKEIQEFFEAAKKDGKRIVCYGAAAKGNTLLNYCKLDKQYIECVVDKNPHKQGLYLPGVHLPIKDAEETTIQDTRPDYLVIIPWNIKDEIMEQTGFIKNWGAKFVILTPKVKVYS